MNRLVVPKQTNKFLEINGESIELLPEVLNEMLALLLLSWERCGKPKSVFSTGGEKLMETIIASWIDVFPRESREWVRDREQYKVDEMSIHDQVKTHSGRSLASIPLYIHKMMKAFFTDDKEQDRKYYMKLVGKFPQFRMANKV